MDASDAANLSLKMETFPEQSAGLHGSSMDFIENAGERKERMECQN